MQMSQRELIIFDLDDTLVDTSHVYWIAREGFINTLMKSGKVDSAYVLELFESIDEKNMKKMGFVPERYGHTMQEAYEFLVEEGRVLRDPQIEYEIRAHGQIVLNQLPDLIEGARQLLVWASKRFNLVLMTRGVEPLQKRKIIYSEIAQYFNDIRIVSQKDASHFKEVISDAGAVPENTWVIGDSIRSDINPAIEAGTKAILFQYTHHSYYWRQEYGVVPIDSFFRINNLMEAIPILENPSAVKKTTPKEWNLMINAPAD